MKPGADTGTVPTASSQPSPARDRRSSLGGGPGGSAVADANASSDHGLATAATTSASPIQGYHRPLLQRRDQQRDRRQRCGDAAEHAGIDASSHRWANHGTVVDAASSNPISGVAGPCTAAGQSVDDATTDAQGAYVVGGLRPALHRRFRRNGTAATGSSINDANPR